MESRNPDLDKPMGQYIDGSSFGDHASERRNDDSKEPKSAKIWRGSLFRKPKNEFSLPHGQERVENYNTNSPQSRSSKKKFDRNMRDAERRRNMRDEENRRSRLMLSSALADQSETRRPEDDNDSSGRRWSSHDLIDATGVYHMAAGVGTSTACIAGRRPISIAAGAITAAAGAVTLAANDRRKRTANAREQSDSSPPTTPWASRTARLVTPPSSPQARSSIFSGVSSSHQQQLYDVFLIHAGPQKKTAARDMKRHLQESSRFRCFLDKDDIPGKPRKPNQVMEDALLTCRYAVVILSKDFLERPYPRRELAYAFKRNEWILSKGGWMSLQVVLWEDLTVEDYKRTYESELSKKSRDLEELPPIHELHLAESKGRDWSDVCRDVQTWLLGLDQYGALDNWVTYLHRLNLDAHFNVGVPRATDLYGRRRHWK